ncbi:16S rRNA methyltransferase [Thermoplasmatales archaeon ex4484_36]|nr:MAG: 16S rRNA methyltransferase [Thermoplasmatales archaeon ex4484_36]RLF54313.1 MAG: 16S rRNA methyltransferase [Thermoplasmata archaeon]RLF69734.1 MAG: 16S rRNA methyltransferase [Thermoplasmata archaeon]RLF71682.1 MAG: 16S rRNA methyltransferase [Thermoplasmata archaeon]RLF73335.1 MAG: 16S rRNA methyltransferase [Thermoplasmata archaeon]
MLQLILADSEVELIPEELWTHPAVLRHSRKRSKKAKEMLLDATYHHSALKGEDRKRRGRPDIVHTFLLLAQDSIINKLGQLQIWIHTRGDNLIWVNPEVRPPKHYSRFVGLLEELFRVGWVPTKTNPLMVLEKGVPYSEVLKRAESLSRSQGRGVKKIAMSPQGMVVEPYHYMKEFMRKEGEVKDLVITIGGFPHGDYLSPVYELTEESVSIYPVMLTVWTVVAELLTSYRLAADLTTPNVSPSEEA